MNDIKYVSDIKLTGSLQYNTKHFIAEIIQLENETFEVRISKKEDKIGGNIILTHFMTFRNFSFSYAFDKAKSRTNSLEKILQEGEVG